MSMKIFKYQPVVTPGPFGTDYRPRVNLEHNDNLYIEIAEFEDWRYVGVDDSVTVEIPEEVTTWEEVVVTPEIRNKIKRNSPYCILAQQNFINSIRKNHSLDDELYYARISTGVLMTTYTLRPGEAELLTQYQVDVEEARVELHAKYAAIGLTEPED